MNLSALAIKRPVAAAMLTIMVIVVGFISVIGIPLDLIPNIELPVALVMTTYSGTSPEEMESMVTEPIESALASTENLDSMMSYSMEGSSIVVVQYAFGTDMEFATLEMREKIARVKSFLPKDVSDPMVMKMDMNSMPVQQIFVSSETLTLTEINRIIDDNISPRIERCDGVASINVMGGVEDEIAVKFNQEELGTYGLSLSTIAQLLGAENINLPSGNVNKGSTEVIVRTIGEFENADDVKNLPVTISDMSIVRLGDIASVEQGIKKQETATHVDGVTAIGIMVSKQSDANTVSVSDAVGEALEELEQDYPELHFVVGYNSADYIEKSVNSVATSALEGAALAIIVVFLFLRNVRTTIIIAISIPTSLFAAFAVMSWRGMTLNIITLCALTICVGMLVDNAIVVLENIFRLRQEIPDAAEASRKGATEVFVAVVASTLTTIMVFLPIALSGGLAGMMFKDFCLTIVIALLASLLVAVTVIPMLCSKIMQGTVSTTYMRIGKRRYKYRFINKFSDFIERLTEMYEAAIRKALGRKKKIIVSSICIFLASLLLLLTVGFELMPESDEGMFSVTVDVPDGTSLDDTVKIMSEIEDYILALPELEHVSMSTGSLSSMSLDGNASLTASLIDRTKRDRTAAEIAEKLEKDLSYITEADISASASDSMGSMSGSSADISLVIKGKDISRLQEIGYDMRDQLKNMDCVTSAELDVAEGSPEIQVVIDRMAAAHYGVTAAQLASGLSSALDGTTATKVTVDGSEIDVTLSLDDKAAASVENLKDIKIMGSKGVSVPVGQIAKFENGSSPAYIYRVNQTNTIQLNVNVEGTSATGGASEVAEFAENYQFPDGYYYENSGSYEQMMDAFGSLFKALIAAIALVFLLLSAQFESVKMAVVVMMAVPFAMTGAFIAMFFTGTSLSMTSFLGLIMLVGTVVNNSILLVEFINQYKEKLGVGEALVLAGKLRLRPILMSCVTTVVGMIPLSLGIGEGGETLAPMAISIIGGLTASTIITLFLVPVLYSVIYNRDMKRAEKKAAKAAEIKLLEAEWEKEDLENAR
ncbi:MAG: efflux RND transporter permease subunit [Clostridia bacterium]|nr:efflux RND transporter permease subunit [Clostridia bacterium]